MGRDTLHPNVAICLGMLFLAVSVNGQATEESGTSAFSVPVGVRQLFLDDVGIAKMENVRRVLHEPARYENNPVLVPDTEWEDRCQVYGTAYYDEQAGLFKMWYLTLPKDRGLKPLNMGDYERAPHTTLAAYAESKDGIHWVKPKLGIFPYDGNKENNLLGMGKYNCEGISVLHEPQDPDPERRWKAVYWDHGTGGWEVRNGGPYAIDGPLDGLYVSFSADGIHWNPYEGNPVLKRYCDTNQNVVFDPKLKKYVIFSRLGFGRKIARTESEDFLHWTEPELVVECDERDGPGTQFYGAGVDLYEGLYIAMLWMYREGGDGKIDTQIAVSRDGFHWTRVADRAVWLKLGEDDSWEGGMVRSVERIINRGDLLYVYYCGVHGAHTGPNRQKVERKYPTCIGLVTLRRDGFVSLRADEQEGIFLTDTFQLPEGKLHLNADAQKGSIVVSLCDAEGNALCGPSKPIQADVLDGKVRWEKAIPKDLRGKNVRLKFTMQNADLYSYWFE